MKKSSAKQAAANAASAKGASAKTPAPAASRRTVKRKPAETKPKGSAKRTADVDVNDLPTEEIWAHYQIAKGKGDGQRLETIRNVLMERHFPLVKYIAERLLQTLPKSIELDDLVSAGLFGLMDAIRGFDPDRGIKFKTYCTTRIRGSILDQLRSQDWVPRLVRLKASRIDKALQKLTGRNGPRAHPRRARPRALEMDHHRALQGDPEPAQRQEHVLPLRQVGGSRRRQLLWKKWTCSRTSGR